MRADYSQTNLRGQAMPASTFLSVFAKSPIKPIEEHIRKVHQASELLLPFFDAVYQQNWQLAADVRKNIVTLEKEADKRNVDYTDFYAQNAMIEKIDSTYDCNATKKEIVRENSI